MRREPIRVALLAIALLLLFSELAPGARGTSSIPPPLRFEATVDRIEDDWLVLDLPPFPSLDVPREMAAWALEGDPVVLVVERGRRSASEKDGTVLSPWTVLVTDAGPPLALRNPSTSTEFRWPRELAPVVRAGDALTFGIEPSPGPDAAQKRKDTEALRAHLLGS